MQIWQKNYLMSDKKNYNKFSKEEKTAIQEYKNE